MKPSPSESVSGSGHMDTGDVFPVHLHLNPLCTRVFWESIAVISILIVAITITVSIVPLVSLTGMSRQ